MTESMIVEAVRAAGAQGVAPAQEVQSASRVADPSAVARFEAAMSADPVHGAAAVDAIPFASQAAAAWRGAQANNQGILHRIRALTQLRAERALSAPEMIELQYEVANLAFQQEVVTKVADKSSSAIQTLIRNQ